MRFTTSILSVLLCLAALCVCGCQSNTDTSAAKPAGKDAAISRAPSKKEFNND